MEGNEITELGRNPADYKRYVASGSRRISSEIQHDEKIIDKAEYYWGWTSSAGKARAARRASLLIEKAGLLKAQRALEIGCGTGVFTEQFVAAGVPLWAVDLYDGFLRAACRKCSGKKLKVCAADAHSLPFKDGSFDSVVGSSVLHHLSLAGALDEIKRVLKPGGLMAFAEPNMLNPIIFFQKNIPMLKRIAGDSPGETAFIRWRISKELEAHGFEKVSAEPHEFLHPAVPSGLIRFVSKLSRMIEKLPFVKEISGSLLIYARKA